MIQTIRNDVFETNSSSVHTLVICSTDEWDDFKNGLMIYDMSRGELRHMSDKEKQLVDSRTKIGGFGYAEDNFDSEDVIEENGAFLTKDEFDKIDDLLTFDDYNDWVDRCSFESFDDYREDLGVHVFGYMGYDG